MMRTEQTNASGIEAAYFALKDSEAAMITGVPGFPINGLFSRLQADGSLKAQWQYNEKIAYEMAVGASVTGNRAAVVSKHVGINVMADPLIISATHGIGAGIVVIAGDDIGAFQSQNEQDSRWYGKLAEIPVYDPATAGGLYDAIVQGFELSERISAPVIVRVVDLVLHKQGAIRRAKTRNPHKKIDERVWEYTMYGKHQHYLAEGWSHAAEAAEASPMNRRIMRSRTGIISSGYVSVVAAGIAEEKVVSHLALEFVNPLPRDLINDFLQAMDRVIVCEEAYPFIEEQLGLPKVKGRMTGHLPRAGPLDEASIREALENVEAPGLYRDVHPETHAARGFAIGKCDECPYTPVYDAIKSLNVPVAGDMGCSILTANPPYNMLDAACALGSAVSTACGFGEKGLALIGDFGILHTGLQALLNARYNGHQAVVVVFANREAAMTGGQALPDISILLRDIFKDDCTIADVGTITESKVKGDLEKLLKEPGLKLYVIPSTCKPGHVYKNAKP